jgi:hypothetical protein
MPNVKGTALLPAVKLLRKNREKSESYLDDVARKMCTQRILPGSWYPMEQADPVMVAVTKLIGGNPRSAMEVIGSFLAANDLKGVYSNIVYPGDVPKTLRRAVLLWRSYFDTGVLTYVQPDAGKRECLYRLENCLEKIPYCNGIIGMAKIAIELAGKGARGFVDERRCTLRGEGLCEFHLSWR